MCERWANYDEAGAAFKPIRYADLRKAFAMNIWQEFDPSSVGGRVVPACVVEKMAAEQREGVVGFYYPRIESYRWRAPLSPPFPRLDTLTAMPIRVPDFCWVQHTGESERVLGVIVGVIDARTVCVREIAATVDGPLHVPEADGNIRLPFVDVGERYDGHGLYAQGLPRRLQRDHCPEVEEFEHRLAAMRNIVDEQRRKNAALSEQVSALIDRIKTLEAGRRGVGTPAPAKESAGGSGRDYGSEPNGVSQVQEPPADGGR